MLTPHLRATTLLRSRLALPLTILVLLVAWVAFAIMTISPFTAYTLTFSHEVFDPVYRFFSRLLPAQWQSFPASDQNTHLLVGAIYWSLMILIWISYLSAARLIAQGSVIRLPFVKSPIAPIMLLTILFTTLALFWVSMYSIDLYTYGTEGKIVLSPLHNPFIYPHTILVGDPLLDVGPLPEVPSVYGPVWIFVETLVAWLTQPWHGSPTAISFGFRLWDQALIWLSTLLIWAISGRLGWPTPRRAAAAALFGWSPLLIVEMAGSGHNDMTLIFFVLLALYLHLRGAWPLAIAALTCAALVKVTALLFIPAYLLLLIRSSRDPAEAIRRVLSGGLILAGLVALTYAPFADPNLISMLLHNTLVGGFENSTALALYTALTDAGLALRGSLLPQDLSEHRIIETLHNPVAFLPFLIWGALAIFFTWRVRDFPSLLHSWAVLALTYMVIASTWYWPWYSAWVTPFVALLPSGNVRRGSLWLLFGATLFYGCIPLVNQFDAHGKNYVMPAACLAPVWLYFLWLAAKWLARRWRKADDNALPQHDREALLRQDRPNNAA